MKILRSIRKIGITALFLLLAINLAKTPGTNSFFSASVTATGNSFTAGVWIPELTMSVDPANPDAGDWYMTKPCVTLTSSLDDTTIYYKLSNDGDPKTSGNVYGDKCVEIPDGIHDFEAIALNNKNENWKSDVVSGNFKVDSDDPMAHISKPSNGATVSGEVDITGTASDSNLKSWEIIIKNSDGDKVGGSSVQNISSSPADVLYKWDTTGLDDGKYSIELRVGDEAGRFSSDAVSVSVKNTTEATKGDVVINEVMWMGSEDKGNPADDGPNDQWVELKNISGKKLHLKGWKLKYNKESTGKENTIATIGNDRDVKNGEYFLLSHYNKNHSAINVERDDVMNNFDYGEFQLVLYDDKGNVIDIAGDKSGVPTKGDNTNFYSMERNDDLGNGTNYDNWHTCNDASSSKYWDDGRLERGTPGAENLSGKDPVTVNADSSSSDTTAAPAEASGGSTNDTSNDQKISGTDSAILNSKSDVAPQEEDGSGGDGDQP